jgi:hypothetical protein
VFTPRFTLNGSNGAALVTVADGSLVWPKELPARSANETTSTLKSVRMREIA